MVNAGPNPTSGPTDNALAIVAPASFAALDTELRRLGYRTNAVDHPYAALVELLDRPLVYRALVISLPALYREELSIIKTVRSRLPHVDVLLAHTDGRQAALAEAMRLGATALLSDEAVHRLAEIEPSPDSATRAASKEDEPEVAPPPPDPAEPEENVEPLLTADELRALLQEQPTLPPL